MTPESFSLCRGQADRGIGEPDAPIRRGEQYLAAAPALAADPGLLRALRRRLTLDAAPGDYGRLGGRLDGRLGGRLTGWACFPAGPWYFVARLAAAGQHDRRDAYFTHARAWRLADFGAEFDPGLYLGADGLFLDAAPAPGEALPETGLPPPDPAAFAPVVAEPGLAAALIAHLFHGMLHRLPVILAVPPGAFASGTPLAPTLAFARGALPGRLRRRCRVRVFTRDPASFLAPPGDTGRDADRGDDGNPVDLLVIPEDLAATALAAVHRRALLLDAAGERRDGSAPAPGLDDYARAVIAAARRLPAHLTRFGERFDALWQDPQSPPGPDLTDWVTLTYNLAAALAGGPASCAGLLSGYLLPQARATVQVPWARLVTPGDWAQFPPEPLIRLLLRSDEDLTPGERALQTALADAFQRLGAQVDSGLSAWWIPSDSACRRRLLELADREPPLISAAACATLSARLPIADLASGGAPLAGALRAERATGALRARHAEAADLLAHLGQPGVYEVLAAAARAGLLPAPWGHGDLAALPVPAAAALLRRLLAEPAGPDQDALLGRLCARLHRDPEGAAVLAADLFDDSGRLRIVATAPLAALLLRTPVVAARLGSDDLLRLGERLGEDAGPEDPGLALADWYRCLDTRMDQDPADTTRHLIRHGAWLCWRHQAEARLGTEERHRLALAWLTSPALAALRTDGTRTRSPQWTAVAVPSPHGTGGPAEAPGEAPVDVTRETWNQVMADLGPLAPAEARVLHAPATRWPWLHPYQADQVRDLAARCRDPESEALLIAALSPGGAAPAPDPAPELDSELDPELAADLAAAAAWPWISEVIAALTEDATDPFAPLRRRLRATAGRGAAPPDQVPDQALHHPLLRLAAALGAPPADQARTVAPLLTRGRAALARLMAEEPACHLPLPGPDPLLPLFHLAAVLAPGLAPGRQAGTLALWFVHQPDCAAPSRHPGWWEGLLGSVLALTAPRPGPHPAPAEATACAALALIAAERPALPEAARLALDQAWQRLGLDTDREPIEPVGWAERERCPSPR